MGPVYSRLSLHERLFPFRGTWDLAWVAHRYARASLPAMTTAKLLNAALALAECKMGAVRVRSRPFVLRVEPSNTCNLRCPYCVCGNGMDKRPKGLMTMADFTRTLDAVRDSAFILRLDGMGEPTTNPHIFDMIRLAKRRGLSVTMSTNLHTDACDRPEPLLDCGLDRLVVAIDGTTQDSYRRYRVGGSLELVTGRLRRLIDARRKRRAARPIIEVQFIDFGYNHDDIPEMRQLARQWRIDKLQVVDTERTMTAAKVDPAKPRRCWWLWCVLTVDWNLMYRSCTNAWSLPWPRLSLRDVAPREFWNHPLMQKIRQYNVDKSDAAIADDAGCKCHRCTEMLVVPLQGRYLCE